MKILIYPGTWPNKRLLGIRNPEIEMNEEIITTATRNK